MYPTVQALPMEMTGAQPNEVMVKLCARRDPVAALYTKSAVGM